MYSIITWYFNNCTWHQIYCLIQCEQRTLPHEPQRRPSVLRPCSTIYIMILWYIDEIRMELQLFHGHICISQLDELICTFVCKPSTKIDISKTLKWTSGKLLNYHLGCGKILNELCPNLKGISINANWDMNEDSGIHLSGFLLDFMESQRELQMIRIIYTSPCNISYIIYHISYIYVSYRNKDLIVTVV